MLAVLRPLLAGLVVAVVCLVLSLFPLILAAEWIRGDRILLTTRQATRINTVGWVCLLLAMIPAGYVGVAQARPGRLAARAERLGWGLAGPLILALVVIAVPDERGYPLADILRKSSAMVGGAVLGGWWAERRRRPRRQPD